MSRRAPRPAAAAVERLVAALAPETTVARIQAVWADAVGPVIAREATPVAERGGVVTIDCRSAVWAQELDLMSQDVVGKLNDALGAKVVKGLRCRAIPPP
jgi:predicted nucleic acid-binding Zn ribbon protein